MKHYRTFNKRYEYHNESTFGFEEDFVCFVLQVNTMYPFIYLVLPVLQNLSIFIDRSRIHWFGWIILLQSLFYYRFYRFLQIVLI